MTSPEPAIDKVVVITGASAGIGAELAIQLASRGAKGAKGAKVVLPARRKAELDALAGKIGANAFVVVTDVGQQRRVGFPRSRRHYLYGAAYDNCKVSSYSIGLTEPIAERNLRVL